MIIPLVKLLLLLLLSVYFLFLSHFTTESISRQLLTCWHVCLFGFFLNSISSLCAPLCLQCRAGSSRAYKVAGVTLLACILIAGQAMVAYFLLTQKAEIRLLEEQSDSLRSEMTWGRMSGGGM